MPSSDERRLLKNCKGLIDRIPALRTRAGEKAISTDVDYWRADAIAALEGLCGTDSVRVRTFREIRFEPYTSFGAEDREAAAKAITDGLAEAEVQLNSALRDKAAVRPTIMERLWLLGKVPTTIVAMAAFMVTAFTLLSNVGSLRYSQEVNGRQFVGTTTNSFPGGLDNCRDTCVQAWRCKAWHYKPELAPGEITCWHFDRQPNTEQVAPMFKGGIIRWKLFD